MVSPGSVQEIERAFNAEFARKGWGGSIVLRGESAELHGQGTVWAIELGDWLEQWELLPPDMRNRHVQHAALRLRNCLPGEQRQLNPSGGTWENIKSVVSILAIPLTLAALVYALWDNEGSDAEAPQTAAGQAATSQAAPVLDPATRSRDVCVAARRRLYAGASMGVDSAGWVVELWLARRSTGIAQDAKLAEFKDHTRLAEQLGIGVPGKVVVVPAKKSRSEFSQITLRLEGGFVAPFMERLGRPRFVQMMHRAADAAGAQYAALYGRCAHLKYRDIGAAFRGENIRSVAASLLFVQGPFMAPPAFAPTTLRGRSNALAFLAKAQGALSKEVLREQVQRSGGRLAESAEGDSGQAWTAITFGLGAPVRSQKLARALVKRAKLSGNR